MRSSLTKEQVAQAVIAQMEEYNDELKVETKLFENYRSPDKVIWKSNDMGFCPDIKMVEKDGTLKLYEIELDDKINADKWRLFSMYAKMQKGEFTVIVPEYMIGRVETIFAERNFKNIKLMFVPN